MKDYRVLVTGSRDWTLWMTLETALEVELTLARAAGERLVVVHGGARGADAMADIWAVRNGVAVERHPARWRMGGVYNPYAGLVRNREMVKAGADVCLAFIRSGSRGATHCAQLAKEAGIRVEYHRAD